MMRWKGMGGAAAEELAQQQHMTGSFAAWQTICANRCAVCHSFCKRGSEFPARLHAARCIAAPVVTLSGAACVTASKRSLCRSQRRATAVDQMMDSEW